MRKVAFQISKLSIYEKKNFVVPSLNVTTNASLGFIPFFNPMSRHKEIMSRHIFYKQALVIRSTYQTSTCQSLTLSFMFPPTMCAIRRS